MFTETGQTNNELRDFVTQERKKSLSDREWKFRLAGYGYDVRKSSDCLKLVTLRHKVELCDLPLDRPEAS
ncbi:hypothetical protein M8756_07710 [Lutimaribacter sp. EGI FJ00015]|uniref:Uncharacterized protein n=1 Tax=Lutimaribacter degradans TaxID=2945989 RepID=A0ACC5ZUB5_9RHOB|nr:hypothetical protein [Lutimaribacter sp. EGI FJ00013]MCM2561775.1 hypothetical protein [Lutimaribacter sp. EGI FJ00013]MCO0613192.1 hypothetical protein [Lutimaribacter sp. EGI FJ00015]MCO0635608.1 hypothetical protein [Lutimaribacter sp. EGI FJ00014]